MNCPRELNNKLKILLDKSIITWSHYTNKDAWRISITTFDQNIYHLGFNERLDIPTEILETNKNAKRMFEEVLQYTLTLSIISSLSKESEDKWWTTPCSPIGTD